MLSLTPMQLFIWIVCLELISAPIIVFVATAIIIAKRRSKEQYITTMLKGTASAIETYDKSIDDFVSKMKTLEEEKQNEH